MQATVRTRVGYGLWAVLIGAAASSLYSIAQWPRDFFQPIFIGGVIGGSIYITMWIYELILGRCSFSPDVHAVFRALGTVVCGVVGSVAGLWLGVHMVGGDITIAEIFQGRGRLFIVMATLISGLSAVVVRSYDLLKNRLSTALDRIKEQEWTEKELQMARAVQTRLLPPAVVKGDHFTVAARNLPARLVAGDFYDVVRADDGSVFVVIADVAGKGMAASLIMASVKAVLPFVVRGSVSMAMRQINEKLVGELARREFVALACARFDPNSGTVEIANAGCPDVYCFSPAGVAMIVAPGPRLPLGIRADVAYETVRSQLAPGDRLLFVTDGIPEAPTLAGEPLGYDAFAKIIAHVRNADAESWLDEIVSAVRAEVKEGYEDDWTAVVLQRH